MIYYRSYRDFDFHTCDLICSTTIAFFFVVVALFTDIQTFSKYKSLFWQCSAFGLKTSPVYKSRITVNTPNLIIYQHGPKCFISQQFTHYYNFTCCTVPCFWIHWHLQWNKLVPVITGFLQFQYTLYHVIAAIMATSPISLISLKTKMYLVIATEKLHSPEGLCYDGKRTGTVWLLQSTGAGDVLLVIEDE